ncbi:putative Na(+)/H(+) antiporter subunit G [Staphylococcus piscifermentans]|uniref:Putative antiporter subunit mnhG2 n=1 Tax=Staphylococcus piscifermentans TaxID=70258 RepID=A0A239TKH7_9STAP|nr:Na+/H+ antiporter subunit G [Staphylococcus piscifermentans]RTX83234.1 Na+/H+ antiporter subunit G [Staphylococcus piscifermentans]GEP85207.1 putative antiporter subunit mnhG2 [Staphylococcus piscifermentans]SNU98072.1 putative Na(+)/H(+) antiporter subunit G [Staphylococcus piscifermentans]
MNLNEIVSLFAAVLILLGSIVALISAIGIVKFKDVFLRAHAATKSSTLSVLLSLTGVFIYFLMLRDYFSVRTLLTILFLYLTSPVAGQMIVRAAYNIGSYMYMKDSQRKGTSLNIAYNRKVALKNRKLRAARRKEITEAFRKGEREPTISYKPYKKKK